MLGEYQGIPITYAGGIGSFQDLIELKQVGKGRLDVTIGSGLDLFGGDLEFERVLEICRGEKK